MTWWVTFSDGEQACLELPRDYVRKGKSAAEIRWDMIRLAVSLRGQPVKAIWSLPWPAAPRLNPQVDSYGDVIPAFCFQPERCAGRYSCGRPRSCVD